MTKPNIGDLNTRIEQLVHEHIRATRDAAECSLRQAFGGGSPAPRAVVAKRARSANHRRLKVDLEALSVRLCAAVHAKPGETMSILSVEVGVKSRELLLPMKLLKERELVRAVGHRNFTRYFPLS